VLCRALRASCVCVCFTRLFSPAFMFFVLDFIFTDKQRRSAAASLRQPWGWAWAGVGNGGERGRGVGGWDVGVRPCSHTSQRRTRAFRRRLRPATWRHAPSPARAAPSLPPGGTHTPRGAGPPAPSWPFARPPPKRGGSRRCSTFPKGRGSTRFRFEPEVTQYRSSLSFGPCTATNHYALLFPVV
jgi:hypothetical protein